MPASNCVWITGEDYTQTDGWRNNVDIPRASAILAEVVSA